LTTKRRNFALPPASFPNEQLWPRCSMLPCGCRPPHPTRTAFPGAQGAKRSTPSALTAQRSLPCGRHRSADGVSKQPGKHLRSATSPLWVWLRRLRCLSASPQSASHGLIHVLLDTVKLGGLRHARQPRIRGTDGLAAFLRWSSFLAPCNYLPAPCVRSTIHAAR